MPIVGISGYQQNVAYQGILLELGYLSEFDIAKIYSEQSHDKFCLLQQFCLQFNDFGKLE